jgi:hypothetical protein
MDSLFNQNNPPISTNQTTTSHQISLRTNKTMIQADENRCPLGSDVQNVLEQISKDGLHGVFGVQEDV